MPPDSTFAAGFAAFAVILADFAIDLSLGYHPVTWLTPPMLPKAAVQFIVLALIRILLQLEWILSAPVLCPGTSPTLGT